MNDEQRQASARVVEAWNAACAQLDRAIAGIIPLLDRLAALVNRRYAMERKLGYRVPDWVWEVWERQRETFGSGNGKSKEGDDEE